MRDPQPIAIIFDGSCRFCRSQMEWIRCRDPARQFEFIPFQTAGLIERFPSLVSADFNTGMCVVFPDGTMVAGADAVYAVARRLHGWRWLAALYRIPSFTCLGRRAYKWIAMRRYRFAGRCDDSCHVP